MEAHSASSSLQIETAAAAPERRVAEPSTPTRGSAPAPTGASSPPRFTESQMLLALDAPKSPAASPVNMDSLGKMKMPGAMKVAALALANADEEKAICKDLQAALKCPLTGRVFVSPHVLSDGSSVELTALKRWLQRGHVTSPLTGKQLGSLDLVPNLALQSTATLFRTHCSGPRAQLLEEDLEAMLDQREASLRRQNLIVDEAVSAQFFGSKHTLSKSSATTATRTTFSATPVSSAGSAAAATATSPPTMEHRIPAPPVFRPPDDSANDRSSSGSSLKADLNDPVCVEDSTCGLPVLDASTHTRTLSADVDRSGNDIGEVLLATNVTFALGHYDRSEVSKEEGSGSGFFGWRLLPTTSSSGSSSSSVSGLKVGHIDPSGAAAGAGVRVGWVMVKAGGVPIRNGLDWSAALQRAVDSQAPSLMVTFSKQWVMSGTVTPLPASAGADSQNSDAARAPQTFSSSSTAAQLADAADANLEAALLRGESQHIGATSGSSGSGGHSNDVSSDGAGPGSSSSSRLVVESLARAQEQADQERALKRAREKALQAGLVEDDEGGAGSSDNNGKKRKKKKNTNKKGKNNSEVVPQLEPPLAFASAVVAAQPPLGAWDIVGAAQLRHSIAEGLSGQRLDEGWGAHGEVTDDDEAFWADMARAHGARREALHLLRCLYGRVNPSKLNQVDHFAIEYSGAEQQLLERVAKKYQLTTPPTRASCEASGDYDQDLASLERERVSWQNGDVYYGSWKVMPAAGAASAGGGSSSSHYGLPSQVASQDKDRAALAGAADGSSISQRGDVAPGSQPPAALQRKMHGSGVFKYASGDYYQGDFKNGMRHGYGEYYWPNGMRYYGEWRSDQRDGRGIFYDQNGRRSDDTYTKDKKSCSIPLEKVDG